MHIYEKDGNKYPSVTTVLSLIDTDESLLQWANIMGFRKRSISQIKNDALELGTKTHSALQYLVDPESCDEPEYDKNPMTRYKIEKSISNFKRLFADIKFETIFTEKTLFDDDRLYAGTCDWFVKINDKNMLIDFKTSKKPYHNYKFQLGGYMGLIEKNTGFAVDMGAILQCNDSGASLHPVSRENLLLYRDGFYQLNEFYHIKDSLPLQNTYDYNLVALLKNNQGN